MARSSDELEDPVHINSTTWQPAKFPLPRLPSADFPLIRQTLLFPTDAFEKQCNDPVSVPGGDHVGIEMHS